MKHPILRKRIFCIKKIYKLRKCNPNNCYLLSKLVLLVGLSIELVAEIFAYDTRLYGECFLAAAGISHYTQSLQLQLLANIEPVLTSSTNEFALLLKYSDFQDVLFILE